MSAQFKPLGSISEEALSQDVSGEVVILDLKSEQYFGLDKVGSRIWQLMQESSDLQQVFDTMLEEFDVGPDQLETDMKKLLDELSEAGLISYGEDQNTDQAR